MKFHDAPAVGVGLVLFLGVAGLPAWVARSGPAVPTDLPACGDRCVAPVELMRADHMTLLVGWRDAVVRDGDRSPAPGTAGQGACAERSLACCLDCHGGRDAFCERCHAAAGVEIPCWGCHAEGEGRGEACAP